MFYQWNRRVGWSSTDPMVNSDGGTVWDSSNPSGTGWEAQNDPCPAGFRVPTRPEFSALSSGTNRQETTINGVSGIMFSDNGNFIFFPAYGNRSNFSFNPGVIWDNYEAHYSFFEQDITMVIRSGGLSQLTGSGRARLVRCVRE